MIWYLCSPLLFLNLLKFSYSLAHSFQNLQIMLETVRPFFKILIHHLQWEYVQRSALWKVLSRIPLNFNPEKVMKCRQNAHFSTNSLSRPVPQLPGVPILKDERVRHTCKSQCWQESCDVVLFFWMFLFIPILYWNKDILDESRQKWIITKVH